MVALSYIARGDVPALTGAIPSPLLYATASQWSNFVRALVVQELRDDTTAGFGLFALRPRRLEDLGIMTNLRRVGEDENGRPLWDGDFILPLTRDRFLMSYLAQYNALVKSVVAHAANATKLPKNMTTSGALAILHHAGGPWGLKSWVKGNRRKDTAELFDRTNGLFDCPAPLGQEQE